MFAINEKNLKYFFILVFIGSISIVHFFSDRHATIEANKRIETILEQHKALHKYIENTQKPVIYKLKAEGKLYNDWFDPKILSFTYIARNIHNYYQSVKKDNNQEAYEYKLASNNPRNLVNLATPFEKNILDRFNKKEITEFHTILEENQKSYYYKALPIAANQESCMLCHSTPEIAPKEMVDMYGDGRYYEKVGDIRAMISLKIPITEIQKEALHQFFIMSSIIFVLLLSFYLLTVRIIRQKYKIQEEMKKNREKDAKLAEQAKMAALGAMIGNIAHQWRQPLSIISAAASGTKLEKEMGILSDKNLLERLDSINLTAQHMSRTIDDFKDFLKGDNRVRLFNLTEEINKCLEIEEDILKANNINIVKNFDDTITLNNIAHGLSQSLINIISNSKDIMIRTKDEDNRFLFIETKQEENQVMIILKDSGNGISDDIINHIFEPYFTTKHQSQGTGLGLHITYQIITDNMNGSIKVNNEVYSYNGNKYTGAKFTITLPNL